MVLARSSSAVCTSPIGDKFRQLLWIPLNRSVPAQFAPLAVKVLAHRLPSNPRGRAQVAAIPVFATTLSIHGATSP